MAGRSHRVGRLSRHLDLRLGAGLHAGLAGDEPMAEALAGYERRRNEDAFPLYEQNCRAASFFDRPSIFVIRKAFCR